MREGISIIVCCYNSALRIEETLRHIFALQLLPDLACEVLLINNSSKDDTVSVALRVYERFKNDLIPLLVINEPNPGLASARARGVKESSYDIILFCDDDNHLNSKYLLTAKKIFDQNPAVGVLGCWAKPKLPFDPGRWIDDFYGALAIGKQAESDGNVKWVFGAGMVLRKKILKDLTQRNIRFFLSDRVGSRQTSGGDTELCLLAKFIGYDVYYSSSLILEHNISAGRLSKSRFIRTSGENFYAVMFLFLLDNVVYESGQSPSALFVRLFFDRFYKIFYFIPRCIFGKHQFYSFISVLGNLLFTAWMVLNVLNFYRTLASIKSNLADHG